jgi:uncharacterized iron-regulated protein
MTIRGGRAGAAVVMAAALFAAAVSAQTPPSPRVFDSARGQFVDLGAMFTALSTADVVFLGEQHDSPAGHKLELMTLQGLSSLRPQMILGLEMFERDAQDPLDHFSMGHITEDDFLQAARPWPQYKTDYKPLVDFAVDRNWPVIASNAPQPIVTEVSKRGLDALSTKSADDKKLFAADLQCPTDDDYHARFLTAMADHPVGDGQAMDRIYLAQCVRDETMAESVARAWKIGAVAGAPLFVHVNGAFHSDFHEGTAVRTERRLPGKKVLVVSLLPVTDVDAVTAPDTAERKRADFLVYSVK